MEDGHCVPNMDCTLKVFCLSPGEMYKVTPPKALFIFVLGLGEGLGGGVVFCDMSMQFGFSIPKL